MCSSLLLFSHVEGLMASPVSSYICFAYSHKHLYFSFMYSKTKKASQAKKCLEKVKATLGKIDASLAKVADEYIPANGDSKNMSTPSRKRKASETTPGSSARKKKKTVNKNSELAQREERAMEMLSNFVQERGGQRSQVANFSARVTRKASGSGRKFDTNFFNEAGRRFRSMLEVGRFLGLVKDGGPGGGGARVRRKAGSRKATSREQEAEKKKLRKELERLRKQHQRATKSLDEFTTDEKDGMHPIDDSVLMEEKVAAAKESGKAIDIVTPTTCAAARVPDVDSFPGLPENCVPDLLMTWDFLCTFERALSLSPIALDDFINALVYFPPEGQMGDDLLAPPVYLAEAHLGLIKLLFQDKTSDDWWWSTLETDEEAADSSLEEAEMREDETKPPIKINMTSVLAETEDPLITTSWLHALEKVRDLATSNVKETKEAVKAAMKVVSNKWVLAYLKKASSKVHGPLFTRRAVLWLADRVKEARPDLADASVSQDEIFKARAKVVDEVDKIMGELPDTFPSVTDDDISDTEYDDDDEEEEDSDEESVEEVVGKHDAVELEAGADDESQKPASVIPPKPLPSYVDMMLPPAKPNANDEFVNPFTWPHLVGATLLRTLHRRKKLLNEMDDGLRAANQMPQLSVAERRERESNTTWRVLTECVDSEETASLVEKGIKHLCDGGTYLQLSVVQRTCILRLLIEVAYDTVRVYDVVSGNYKQRAGAMKALEMERRRAKREAKEKAAADEAAARDQLAAEVREKFLDEKRDEIIKLNDKSKEFSDEVMESLTDEDILGFDDEFQADYDALPGPDSFNKTEVTKMVARLREEAAFDTDALRVISMEDLIEREKLELEELEGQLAGFGGEKALLDPSLDRETVRSIERLLRDISKAQTQAEKLPELRDVAVEQLKDAIADGTIKVLRSAMTAAKKAKLSGVDDETGGVWAVDLMRDAALELEKAKQNKRVLDAQKDLIAKTNKCFIRLDPLGLDRFGNRFWSLGNDTGGQIWAEAEYLVQKDTDEPCPEIPPGFVNLWRDGPSIVVGAQDMEEDFIESGESNPMQTISRQEYHSSGLSAGLVKHHWGCHTTEESLRILIKLLDSRGLKESDLKTKLKDALEEIVESNETQEQDREENGEDDEAGEVEKEVELLKTQGDEAVFLQVSSALSEAQSSERIKNLSSAIGAQIRLRLVIDASKDPPTARYENGVVCGWKLRRDRNEPSEDDPMEIENGNEPQASKTAYINVPVWKVQTERGKIVFCNGAELIDGLARFDKWKDEKGYFENDAAFFSYRNNLGRHCGRAAEAPYACSPIALARTMMRKEGDLYPKLKIRSYDNNWGGKSGSRASWTNSMKDYAYDFETVQQGLLTLEVAFFELTLGFSEYESAPEVEGDIQAILDDPVQRVEIELESIEKNVPGLWNSPLSRAVFIHIVKTCKTTGMLALALDLLCRNTTKYLQRHRLLNVQTEKPIATDTTIYSSTGRPRRMNAWQQKQEESIYKDWY